MSLLDTCALYKYLAIRRGFGIRHQYSASAKHIGTSFIFGETKTSYNLVTKPKLVFQDQYYTELPTNNLLLNRVCLISHSTLQNVSRAY